MYSYLSSIGFGKVSDRQSLDALIDEAARDRDALALVRYIAPAQREDALLEHPQILRQPIVRCGKKAAVGYCPEVYEAWLRAEG